MNKGIENVVEKDDITPLNQGLIAYLRHRIEDPGGLDDRITELQPKAYKAGERQPLNQTQGSDPQGDTHVGLRQRKNILYHEIARLQKGDDPLTRPQLKDELFSLLDGDFSQIIYDYPKNITKLRRDQIDDSRVELIIHDIANVNQAATAFNGIKTAVTDPKQLQNIQEVEKGLSIGLSNAMARLTNTELGMEILTYGRTCSQFETGKALLEQLNCQNRIPSRWTTYRSPVYYDVNIVTWLPVQSNN